VVNTHETHLPVMKGFGMVPWEVLVDIRLTHVDIKTYALLAACARKDAVHVGTRLIARYARMCQTSVRQSIKRLLDCGYVESLPVKRGFRARYRMDAECFRASKVERIDVDAAKKTDRLVICSRCSLPCGGLLKVGWCRRCASRLRIAKIADERIEATTGQSPPSLTEPPATGTAKPRTSVRKAAREWAQIQDERKKETA
jgi:hypothetical protein